MSRTCLRNHGAQGNFPQLISAAVVSVTKTQDKNGSGKLLGDLAFVSRTFEGYFTDTPYVLDMDANLYLGPADHLSRDMHAAVEVVVQFLRQTGRIEGTTREVLTDRRKLLDVFNCFDDARTGQEENEFRIIIHGTYDGVPLADRGEDDLPAGPCGRAINQVKLRFYRLCQRLDGQFAERELSAAQHEAEQRLLSSVYA